MGPQDSSSPSSSHRFHALGAVARMWWMLLGTAALTLAAFAVATGPGLSWRDAALWAAGLSVVAVRYADVRWLGGTTADGEPATLAHWRRHAAVMVAATAAAWGAAHGLRLALP